MRELASAGWVSIHVYLGRFPLGIPSLQAPAAPRSYHSALCCCASPPKPGAGWLVDFQPRIQGRSPRKWLWKCN
jgi:hypothetical protein